MRTPHLLTPCVLLLAALLPACSQAPTTPAATAPAANPSILRLTLPPGVTSTSQHGYLTVSDPARRIDFYVWLVPNVQTLAQAAAVAPGLITPEFKDFKPAAATLLTFRNAPARQLTGPGFEADDGDPGHAELFIFQLGDRFYLACLHGEQVPTARAHDFMFATLQSAQSP